MKISEATARRIVKLLEKGERLWIPKNLSSMLGGHGVTYFCEDGLFYSEESYYDLRDKESFVSRNAIGGAAFFTGRLMRMTLDENIQQFLDKHKDDAPDKA